MKTPKVYFIDDDPIILKLLNFYLRDSNLEIETFETPEALFDRLGSAEAPDLLVSDITLGKMNGIQIVTKVKENYPDIKCAFCSAYINLEMALQVNNLESNEMTDVPYYPKPFEMPGLMEFIEETLSEKTAA